MPSPFRRPASFLDLRRSLCPALDAAAWSASLLLATFLRYNLNATRTFTAGLALAMVTAMALQLGVGWVLLYRWRWRIGSFEEIAALATVVAIVTGTLLIVSVAALRSDLPIGAVVAGGAFTLVLTGGSRCGWRLLRQLQSQGLPDAEGVIVFGAGEAGGQLIDALLGTRGSPYLPVALLDDDPGKRNLQVRRLRVAGGREALPRVVDQTGAHMLVLAIPSAGSALIRDFTGLANDLGIELRVLPPVSQLFGGSVGVADIRPVTDTDLLGRHTVDTHVQPVAGYLGGRRVLVTGAGGSIGSELCRQINRFDPAELIMLDRDESGLHQVQLSIEGAALLDTRNLVICDIRDAASLDRVFAEHRPEVVFHAAALKHLPLLEMWPGEAFKTNVLGTLNVLRAAARWDVRPLVNISTDKAADPISVLGYSKRVAERLTATFAADGRPGFLSVRFGNVLGSRGSVLTTFRAQLERGIPLTVTHPDVTRYFMTVEEAVQLVIQAGALEGAGHVLVLDMGEPVRIAEIAERLAHDGLPVAIHYTGLRPGEKLHETLLAQDEERYPSGHPLIFRAPVPPLDVGALATFDHEAPTGTKAAALRALAESQPVEPQPFEVVQP